MDGATERAHIEQAARLGSRFAIKELAKPVPSLPESLAYLWDWAKELHGRSGVGMSGLQPLSHREIDAWSRLTNTNVEPQEVRALLQLDAVLLAPQKTDETAPATDSAPDRVNSGSAAWPTRKSS